VRLVLSIFEFYDITRGPTVRAVSGG
jgi:hypothetical protein